MFETTNQINYLITIAHLFLRHAPNGITMTCHESEGFDQVPNPINNEVVKGKILTGNRGFYHQI